MYILKRSSRYKYMADENHYVMHNGGIIIDYSQWQPWNCHEHAFCPPHSQEPERRQRKLEVYMYIHEAVVVHTCYCFKSTYLFIWFQKLHQSKWLQAKTRTAVSWYIPHTWLRLSPCPFSIVAFHAFTTDMVTKLPKPSLSTTPLIIHVCNSGELW